MRVVVETFSDPGELAAALRPANVELIPLERGRFSAELTTIDLPRARLRRITESLPRLANVQLPAERTYFAFLADEALAPVTLNGMVVTADAVLRLSSDSNSSQRSPGPSQWAIISLDCAGMDAISRDLPAPDVAPCRVSRVVRPDGNAMRRLRRLYAETIAAAIHSADTLATLEAARGMENQLMEALVECLSGSEQRQPTSVQVRHAAVTERFRYLLDASLDRPLYLPEVCAMLRVSHRTLTSCCQDLLGMSPKRYFHVRRMYMVRRALLQADRHAVTVTEIATRYGFWEFGRFSVQYRALFGETPSATLRKESVHVEH